MSDEFRFHSTSVSHAWGKLFVKSMEPGTISGPICISITDAGNKRPEVDQTVHNALNEHLATQKENFSIEDSANTIFPYSYWERK